MPAGLDGATDPIRTTATATVLERVTGFVAARLDPRSMIVVAIDGIDGAGKSTFADELAVTLERCGVTVRRASIDSFHRPKAQRWARGRWSPAGFYRDSHDLAALRREMLDPLRRGDPFVTAVFDEPYDRTVPPEPQSPVPGGVLVVDGIFLQRAELAGQWDVTVWLDGAARVSAGRVARVVADCPSEPLARVLYLLGWWAVLRRYVVGQQDYVHEVDPAARADVVIDNNDLATPRVVRCS